MFSTPLLMQQFVLMCKKYPTTFALLVVVWAVEIFARFATDSKIEFNEMTGLQFSQPLTYFSYAFVHRDMAHIVGNSLFLLLGMPIESSYGRKALLIIIGFAVIVGALGAVAFYLFSEQLNDEPMVGASTIASAFLIAGLNAIIQTEVPENASSDRKYWLKKFAAWFLVMFILCGLYFFTEGADFSAVLAGGILLGATFAAGMVYLNYALQNLREWEVRQCATIQPRVVQAIKRWLIPILLFAILLFAEITGSSQWFYGNSGHTGGALVGLISSYWLNMKRAVPLDAVQGT